MRYSIIVALDNNFALTNNFVENLLLTESLQNDSELVIVSDGCANIQTIDYLKKLSEKSFPIKIIYNKTKFGDMGNQIILVLNIVRGIFSFS